MTLLQICILLELTIIQVHDMQWRRVSVSQSPAPLCLISSTQIAAPVMKGSSPYSPRLQREGLTSRKIVAKRIECFTGWSQTQAKQAGRALLTSAASILLVSSSPYHINGVGRYTVHRSHDIQNALVSHSKKSAGYTLAAAAISTFERKLITQDPRMLASQHRPLYTTNRCCRVALD